MNSKVKLICSKFQLQILIDSRKVCITDHFGADGSLVWSTFVFAPVRLKKVGVLRHVWSSFPFRGLFTSGHILVRAAIDSPGFPPRIRAHPML